MPVKKEDNRKMAGARSGASPTRERSFLRVWVSFRTNPHEMSLLQKSDTEVPARGWSKSNFALINR
jgi:hypothetical protein